MNYKHLSMEERIKLECWHNLGWSVREIAKELDRHHSTIARELKRGPVGSIYSGTQAQEYYVERRNSCRPEGKYTDPLGQLIEEKLQLTWSPEQIVGRLLGGRISVKTIYHWIYEGRIAQGNLEVLRQKGKRRKPQETRGRLNISRSIHDRPDDVKTRDTFGNWEADTVVSGRGKSKACLATLVERKTRMYIAIPMIDRTSESMKMAIEQALSQYPLGTFQSFTVRGKEFSCHNYVENTLNIPMYFADPYSSWQRGSNENANGLLREFFPKGSDLGEVTAEELDYSLSLIMNRPRKCLNWKTTHEAFMEEVSHLA